MVLFENNESTLEQIAADDVRGWNRYAYLEVRLYYSNASGK